MKLLPRLYLLDIARSLASFAVILSHWHFFSYNGTNPLYGFDRASMPFYGQLKLFYDYGHYGVEFFFILSGFLFFWLYQKQVSEGKIRSKNFWISRFARLYPLHVVTLIIVAVLQAIYFTQSGDYFVVEHNDLYHFGLHLFFASNWGLQAGTSFNAPAWSISIEILLYAIFFWVARAGLGKRNLSLAIAVGSFFLFHLLDITLFRGTMAFFLGGFLFHVIAQVNIRKWVYALCLISWGLVLVDGYLFPFSEWLIQMSLVTKVIKMMFPTFALLASTIASLVFLEHDLVSSRLYNRVKSLSWIGDITYSTYLLNFPMQVLCVILVQAGILAADFFLNPLYFAAFFMLLVVISVPTFRYFERPMNQVLKAVLTSNAKPAKVQWVEVKE